MLNRMKKLKKTKEDPLWSKLLNFRDIGVEIRRQYEAQWIVNLAFLAGKQYTYFNLVSHTLKKLKPLPGRIRKVDNKLWPRVRRQISDFIKNRPEMSVVPNTVDEEDIKAAKIADKVIKAFWQNNKMKSKVQQMAGWIFSTGNVFVDDRWNESLGPTELNEKGELFYLGDADCGVWSPFEVLVPATPMGGVELNDLPWLIKTKWRDLDWLAQKYVKGSEVSEQSKPELIVGQELIMGKISSGLGKIKGAQLLELYLKPSADFPKGLFLVGANGTILEKNDWPFLEFNLEHFKDIALPGNFFGKATMEDGIALQKTWNSTISDIEEYNRTLGKGKLLSPLGSKISVEPNNVTGEIIYYKPVLGHKPELMTLKGLPATYNIILELTRDSLNDLFSQHEVTQGTNKSDLRSGTMVALLREQDAHGQIPAHAIFEEGMRSVMSRVLKRIQRGYTGERTLQISGKDNDYDVFIFQGADLRNHTDVRVKAQSSLPDSRVAREALIMERFQQALYGDPADPEVRRHVMNLLDDAVVKDVYNETLKDEKVARWENRILMKIDLNINNYDNHIVHLKELNLFRKSMDFQKLKLTDVKQFIAIEAKFTKHGLMHQEFINEMIEQQRRQEDDKGNSRVRR